ncbi:MAG: hypothetical protein U5N86_07160 [Planctomycetota bacterium]|nr:hypothetical protein [Planctomycetota bacterium]
MKERTKYERGKSDLYSLHLAGKSSIFVEDDHVLNVNFVLFSDNYTRMFFDEIKAVAVTETRSPVAVLLYGMVGFVIMMLATLCFIPEGVVWSVMGFFFILDGLALVLLGIAKSVVGEMRIELISDSGRHLGITVRRPKAKRERFLARLLSHIERYQIRELERLGKAVNRLDPPPNFE